MEEEEGNCTISASLSLCLPALDRFNRSKRNPHISFSKKAARNFEVVEVEAGDRVALRCEVGSHPPAAAAVLHAVTGTVNLAGGDGAAGPIFFARNPS